MLMRACGFLQIVSAVHMCDSAECVKHPQTVFSLTLHVCVWISVRGTELTRRRLKVAQLWFNTDTHLCFQNDFICIGWLTHPDITPQECWFISSLETEIPAVFVFVSGQHGSPKMMNSLYFLSSSVWFPLFSWTLMPPHASPFLFLLSTD